MIVIDFSLASSELKVKQDMRVILQNFMQYERQEFDFGAQELTLIKGPNGSGKSTIFEAASWCLYRKVQSVAPWHKPNAKTSVTLDFGNFNVSRKRNPGLLTVVVREAVGDFTPGSYDDKIAQNIINTVFGDYEVWLSSCYLEQECRNKFLTSTNAGKMDLLNKSAFHTEDPAEYIGKIEDKIKEEGAVYDNIKDNLVRDIETYQAASVGVDISKELSPEQMQELEGRVTALNERLGHLTKQAQARDIVMSSLHTIDSGIVDVEKQVSKLEDFTEERSKIFQQLQQLGTASIVDFLSEVDNQLKYLQWLEEEQENLKRLEESLPRYDELCDDNIYIYDDLTQTMIQEKNYQENLSMAERLGVAYNKEAIDKAISSISLLIDMQEKLSTLHKIKDLQVEQRTLMEQCNNPAPIQPDLSPPTEPRLIDINQAVEVCKQRQVKLKTSSFEKQSLVNDLQNVISRLSMVVNSQATHKMNPVEEELAAEPNKPDFDQMNKVLELLDKQINLLNKSINNVEKCIEQDERALDVLKCPYCESNVRHQGKILVPCDLSPVDDDRLESMRAHLASEKQKLNEAKDRRKTQEESIVFQRNKYDTDHLAYMREIKRVELAKQKYELEVKEYENKLDEINQRLEEIYQDQPQLDRSLSPNANLTLVKSQLSQIDQEFSELEATLQRYEDGVNMLNKNYNQRLNKYQMLDNQYKMAKQKYDLEQQQRHARIDSIEQELQSMRVLYPDIEQAEISARRLNQMELYSETQRLTGLRSIVCVERPRVNSEHIRRCMEKQQLLSNINKVRERIDGIHASIIWKASSLDLNQFRLQVDTYQYRESRVSAQKESLQETLQQLNNNKTRLLSELPVDVSEEIEQSQKSIEGFREIIELGRRANEIMDMHNKLTAKQEELYDKHVRLTNLNTLRQHAGDVECYLLQNMVDSINASIEDVVNSIFDKPIRITLNLHKVIKSTKKVKPTVNFTINYKGGEFDNISKLSGGERSRLSIALTLALSKLSGCPFLLLDEAFSALDPETEELVVLAIRQHAGDKTVIAIAHDAVEGQYDHTIDMDRI